MISGIYTAIMLVVFLAIVAWAWSKHNKTTFDELSRMALKEDQATNNPNKEHSDE